MPEPEEHQARHVVSDDEILKVEKSKKGTQIELINPLAHSSVRAVRLLSLPPKKKNNSI